MPDGKSGSQQDSIDDVAVHIVGARNAPNDVEFIVYGVHRVAAGFAAKDIASCLAAEGVVAVVAGCRL